jgi:hypothetical protein
MEQALALTEQQQHARAVVVVLVVLTVPAVQAAAAVVALMVQMEQSIQVRVVEEAAPALVEVLAVQVDLELL